MGTGKKEATRRVRQGKTGDGLGNVRTKGENFYRYVNYSKNLIPLAGVFKLIVFSEMRSESKP